MRLKVLPFLVQKSLCNSAEQSIEADFGRHYCVYEASKEMSAAEISSYWWLTPISSGRMVGLVG